MYELIKLGERTYTVNAPARIGLFLQEDGRVTLIDSGNDKDAGKRIKRILDEQGWELAAICNTHSHADHIGGNAYLQRATGCRIYAPGIECTFTKCPSLEPTILYGGNPPSGLRHKFLMAEASNAEMLTASLLPKGMEILPLPGHSPEMVGYRTEDGVIFPADALSSRETLAKYRIGYVFDVAKYLTSLADVKEMRADCFAPSHAAITSEIGELAEENIACVLEIGDRIVSLLSEPLSFEELLVQIFRAYELKMTMEQHALVGSTLRAYLTWLESEGRVSFEIAENRLFCRQT